MWLKLLVLAAFAIFSAGFACSPQRSEYKGVLIADNDSYEASIYRQNCAICHGKEALGKEVDGQLVPSLRFGDAAKRTDEEIYQQIAYGKLPMPSFKGQLSEDEIHRIVVFVRRDLQGRGRESGEY
ncbi:MAG TPA: cytochrome c [Aridibacter sp.]|nr:cytochrome c [Aridibacter sp.]